MTVGCAISKFASSHHVASERWCQLLLWPAAVRVSFPPQHTIAVGLQKLSSPLGWNGLSWFIENTKKRAIILHLRVPKHASVISESFSFIFVEVIFIYFLSIWDSLYSIYIESIKGLNFRIVEFLSISLVIFLLVCLFGWFFFFRRHGCVL